MKQKELERLEAKSVEQRFVNLLVSDYRQAPRVAEAILAEAQNCWQGKSEQIMPGQMRVVLASLNAQHGQAMKGTETKEVIWTIDNRVEDGEVEAAYGRQAVRKQRIQRLLEEAVAQGAVATQEDLARVLNVSVRTIKRDCAQLQADNIYLPTRGNLKGIGRGQTHKAQIIGRWLQGATYDQIARYTHHSVLSVQRYVTTFVRVLQLQAKGLASEEISLLLQIGNPLVQDYLAIYEQKQTPLAQKRVAEALQRLSKRALGQKKRAK